MANPGCEVCGRRFFAAEDSKDWETPFCCPKCVHVADIFDEVVSKQSKAELKVRKIQDEVLKILNSIKEAAVKKEEKVEVSTKLLAELWAAADLDYYDYDNSESFFKSAMALGKIELIAAHLFTDDYPVKLEKIKDLKEAIVEYYKENNWKADKLNRTPEEVIDILIEERENGYNKIFADGNLAGRKVYLALEPENPGVVVHDPLNKGQHAGNNSHRAITVLWLNGKTTKVPAYDVKGFTELVENHREKLAGHEALLEKLRTIDGEYGNG